MGCLSEWTQRPLFDRTDAIPKDSVPDKQPFVSQVDELASIHRQTSFMATVQLPPSELAAYRPRSESNCTAAHSHSLKDPAARPLPDERPLPGNASERQRREGRLLSALP